MRQLIRHCVAPCGAAGDGTSESQIEYPHSHSGGICRVSHLEKTQRRKFIYRTVKIKLEKSFEKTVGLIRCSKMGVHWVRRKKKYSGDFKYFYITVSEIPLC